MDYNNMRLLSTITYEHSQGSTDVVTLYNEVGYANDTRFISSLIVTACIIFVIYAFNYVLAWYLDRHLNNSRFRAFKIITFGKCNAEDVDGVSAMLYAGLIVLIVILALSGILNIIVIKIFQLIIGGFV